MKIKCYKCEIEIQEWRYILDAKPVCQDCFDKSYFKGDDKIEMRNLPKRMC